MKKLWITLAALAALATGFVVTDCSCGETNFHDATVTGRRHVPAWTEVDVSTDSNGNTHTSVTHHPDEWYVNAASENGVDSFNIHTSEYNYLNLPDGQKIVVKVRKGKWMKINYLPTIQN